MKGKVSKLFAKHSMHTNQALINDIVKLLQEDRQKMIKEIEGMLKKPGRMFIPVATTEIDDPDVGFIYNQALNDVLEKLND